MVRRVFAEVGIAKHGGRRFEWYEMQADLATGLPRVGVGEGTLIKKAIIDKNARIGSGVRLLNDEGIQNADGDGGSFYIRDGIIIVPKNAVVRDGTVV